MSGIYPRYWQPALCTSEYVRRPEPGWLIGYRGEAYLIVSITDREKGDWNDADVEEWNRLGQPEVWDRRPFAVDVRKIRGDDTDRMYGMLIHTDRYVSCWRRLPEHYAVCSLCGELAPCAGHHAAVQAERGIAHAVKAMEVPDGFCPACSQPVTNRQKWQGFPGPNVLNPFGTANVRFHLRSKCYGSAQAYEEKWVAAELGRKRTLLTLKCPGHLTCHQDRSADCSAGDECPDIRAVHGSSSSCVSPYSDKVCTRGCSKEFHPGALLRGARRAGDGT